MPKRRCLSCNRLTTGTRCPPCTAERRKVYGPEWQRLSRDARAAQPWCSICGSTEDLTVDHVEPRSLAAGVQTLCRRCNGRKGDR